MFAANLHVGFMYISCVGFLSNVLHRVWCKNGFGCDWIPNLCKEFHHGNLTTNNTDLLHFAYKVQLYLHFPGSNFCQRAPCSTKVCNLRFSAHTLILHSGLGQIALRNYAHWILLQLSFLVFSFSSCIMEVGMQNTTACFSLVLQRN